MEMALCRYRKGDWGSPTGDVVRPSHASAVRGMPTDAEDEGPEDSAD